MFLPNQLRHQFCTPYPNEPLDILKRQGGQHYRVAAAVSAAATAREDTLPYGKLHGMVVILWPIKQLGAVMDFYLRMTLFYCIGTRQAPPC